MEDTLFTLTECENVVKKYLKSETVQTLNSAVVSLPNENFLLRIIVSDGANEKTLSFFVKSTLKIPEIQHILFEEFKKTVPKFDPRITPKFYYKKSDLLYFEDLTWQGFQTCESALDVDHLKVVIKVLAKFHCGSLAYEEIKSRELGNEFRLDQKYKVEKFVVDMRETEIKNVIFSLLEGENASEILMDLEQQQISPHFRRTLCHGNLFIENVMFKYEEQSPVDCKLLNFKKELYLPPICDILQLIFLNTDEEFRQQHLDDLLLYYHGCLIEESKKYFLKIDKVLSYEELRKEAHHFLPLVKLNTAFSTKSEDFRNICFPPILSREDIYTITRNKTGTSNYKLLSFLVTPLDQVNGYLGNYHKLQIKINQNSEETIKCFVKTMPKNASSKHLVQETGCFFKEIFIYQILKPQMQQIEIDMIDECLPSCYFHRSEDLLVFEDLSFKNYRILPSQVPFDLHLLTLTVKKLARFHACMMIFEERKSKELGRKFRLGEEHRQYLNEIFFLKKESHKGAVLMQIGVRSILDVIDLFPEIKTEINQSNFKKVWPTLQELFFEVIKPSHRYRNVLSHGDLWTNNIMVKFDNEEPIDCLFVDYQIIRYCPPAHDFLSVMFLTTNRTIRKKHVEEMKLVYYQELGRTLELYNYKIDEILSFKEFTESVEYIKPQMVMQAIMYRSFCMCTSEEISSFLVSDEVSDYVFFEDRKEYLVKICEKSKIVKNALRECTHDLYDLCNDMSYF